MTLIATIVARRDAVTLTPAILNHIRNTLRGAPPVVLSPGEAADIPVSHVPTSDMIAAALEGHPIDLILTKPRARRKALLIADMDSTMIQGRRWTNWPPSPASASRSLPSPRGR